MIGLTASEIAKVLHLEEKIVQNMFVKAGAVKVRENTQSYTRKEVMQLAEYLIDKSAINEAKLLLDYEKSVEFQMIPKHPDPLYQNPDKDEFVARYVPDPWGWELTLMFNDFAYISYADKEFGQECWEVLFRIKTELLDRKLIQKK